MCAWPAETKARQFRCKNQGSKHGQRAPKAGATQQPETNHRQVGVLGTRRSKSCSECLDGWGWGTEQTACGQEFHVSCESDRLQQVQPQPTTLGSILMYITEHRASAVTLCVTMDAPPTSVGTCSLLSLCRRIITTRPG